jgi:hypothetical protein
MINVKWEMTNALVAAKGLDLIKASVIRRGKRRDLGFLDSAHSPWSS